MSEHEQLMADAKEAKEEAQSFFEERGFDPLPPIGIIFPTEGPPYLRVELAEEKVPRGPLTWVGDFRIEYVTEVDCKEIEFHEEKVNGSSPPST